MSEHDITVRHDDTSQGYWVECSCSWTSFTHDTKVEALAEGARHFTGTRDDCPPHGIPRPALGSYLCAGCGDRFHPDRAFSTVCVSCVVGRRGVP